MNSAYEQAEAVSKAIQKESILAFLNSRESTTADRVLACEQFGCTPEDFYPDDAEAAAFLRAQIGFTQIMRIPESRPEPVTETGSNPDESDTDL